ncbi:hypothetical protein KVR01_008918 [Diaporthe batatas]|uniref:uncharacterized protein n=1 Tax=Diaporthe batatas TaxID=748121 RepID=UPI001D051450|nr:uncharacterized protein KVR01_008918 [Diaporthe batatas]KAG8160654.1 hypothetical protein KVR01_008918 [Diaporthe batatas]
MRRSLLICTAWIRLCSALGATHLTKTHPDLVCPFLSVGAWPSCPVEMPDIIGDGGVSDNGSEWYRSDKCHQVGSEVFCAFTQPSFNAGHGIALVTTAETLQEMASLHVFTDPREQMFGWMQSAGPAYREEQIPGKGIGLVAKRLLRTNEAFLNRAPIVMVDGIAFKRLGRARLTELLTQAVADLPETYQAEYLNLTTHIDVETHQQRVYEIFMKNDFVTSVKDNLEFHSVFPQVSRLNHACRPNSKYTFDASMLTQSVFAAREISPGEELTVTYFDSIQTRSQRQLLSKHGWGFECTCPHCSASEEAILESDGRVEQILTLQRDLDDYSATSTASPEKAELLVKLFESEGLVTRMVEAYYRAAIEYNSVGSAGEAVRFATLCIEEGKVLENSIGPFINNMRELARDPRAHWTWRFRLKAG